MGEEVRIGLIGAGRIGRVHAQAYRQVSGGRLVAVADVIKPAAEKLAQEYGLESYQDYRDILVRPDIDAVLIATPNWLHAETAIAAARAGKHIFCQKPIALTLEDADAMIAGGNEAGVVLQVGFMLRFTPPMPDVKELVASGALGDVISIRAAVFGWEPSAEWFYLKERGVVRVLPRADRLQEDLARIPDHKRENPHVRFFVDNNPGYPEGDELVCIARISASNLTRLAKGFVKV